MATILVIEDEPILARNICDSLAFSGHDVVTVATGEDGVKASTANRPDVILVDYRLPGMDGLEVLDQLRAAGIDPVIVVITAHGNVDTAVAAMKRGASDFLTKPLDLKELQLVIERALRQHALAAQLNYFRDRERAESASDQIIGDSPRMQQVKELIGRIATMPALSAARPPSILITGETGTGKDLAARAIHYAGARREGPFVHVNCTAIPDHLAESELFGHVKGAFTDARADKRGLFELADKGTLFLNEIGHMAPALQAKLLSVIDRHMFRPIGATRERKVNVHVIAATNRDLQEAIEAREFREDLFHRLRVLSVAMPPLRDRGNDIVKLARHFLKLHATRFSLGVTTFTDAALDAMRAYDWPGNVRELIHTIESAVLIADGRYVDVEHLNIKLPGESIELTIEIAPKREVLRLDFANDCPKLDEIEHQIILAALEYAKHNLSRASRILGISRDAIRYRLEKFGKRDGQADQTA